MNRWLLILILVSSLGIAGIVSFVKSKDAGSSLPVQNFPVGWLYVEYPTIANRGLVVSFNSDPCTMGLTGEWSIVWDYKGAFFRAEGGLATEFSTSSVAIQKQSVENHQHEHQHHHNHIPNIHDHGNHNHPHEHEFGTDIENAASGYSGDYHFMQFGIMQQPSDLNLVATKNIDELLDSGTPMSFSGTILIESEHDVIDYSYQRDEEIIENNTYPDHYVYRIWEKMADNLNCIPSILEYDNDGKRILLDNKVQTKEINISKFESKQFNYLLVDEEDSKIVIEEEIIEVIK